MTIVNRNEFAELVGKSAKWVGNWIDEGMPIEGGGGRGKPVMIDSVKAINWLIARELNKQIGDSDDEERRPKPGTKEGEELLTAVAKRRKAVVEADKAEESVIDLDDAGQFLYAIATLYGNELNGLGARLGPEVAAIDEPALCKNRIDVETRRVRAATADRIRGFVAEYRAQHGRHDGSATTEERSAVGE